jgi:hypothetical protein
MSSRTRNLLVVVACLALCGRTVAAQTVVPVALGGDAANRLDIVFLGDGYTSAEMAKFASDVNAAVAGMLAQSPFAEYRNYLNIWRIEVASAESGASHPNQGITRNTAFSASYGCGGIERLICLNTSSVLSVVQASMPANERDFLVVLVNDTEYGGSGGSVLVASLNAQSIELVLHEAGHTFGELADEYGGPPPPACSDTVEPSAVNATKVTDRASIKWGAWIDASTPIPTTTTTNGIPGLFAGAMYCDSTLYRPVYNSKMRSLGQDFWQINVEQLIRRIYAYVDPIDSVSPATSTTLAIPPGGSQIFSVSMPVPATHALSVGWFVDGHHQSSGSQYTLLDKDLSQGSHSVQVVVTDPTSDVRGDPQGLLTGQATWTVTAAGPDFTIAANPSSLTLARGQSGPVALTLTPTHGQFAAGVTFSCSGLPSQAQCAFAPATISSGSGAATVTLTLTTAARSGLMPVRLDLAPPLAPTWGTLLLSLLLLEVGRRTRRRRVLLACVVLLTVAAFVTACGSSASGNPGTPIGTYTVAVTAASNGTSHTATIVLVVQ